MLSLKLPEVSERVSNLSLADRGRCAGDEVASVPGRDGAAGLGLEGQDRHGHILADLNFCGPSKKKRFMTTS